MTLLIYTNKSSYGSDKVGGAETSLRLLAETFASCGHDVTYVTTSPHARFRSHTDRIRGVQILFLPSLRHIASGRLPLWLTRRLDTLFASFRSLSRALSWRLHCENKVDVVLLYYEPHSARWFLRRRARYGYSVVLRMAGLDWYERIKARYGATERQIVPVRAGAQSLERAGGRAAARLRRRYERLFNSVDSINQTSRGLESLVRQRAAELGMHYAPRDTFVQDIGVSAGLGGPAAPAAPATAANPATHTSAPATAATAANPATHTSAPAERPLRAVCATRFSSYQKRQDLLVEAVALLAGSGRVSAANLQLHLVGDGPTRGRIASLVAERGLGEIINLTSFLPQKELWDLLRRADLLCHPCEYEGLSKIVAESMRLGVPVLASKVVPLTDEIRHGETGFLAENSSQAWADALSELIENPKRRESVRTPAAEYASRRYDPKRNATRYLWHFRRIHADVRIRPAGTGVGYGIEAPG